MGETMKHQDGDGQNREEGVITCPRSVFAAMGVGTLGWDLEEATAQACTRVEDVSPSARRCARPV